jgi:hypothetical protein
MNSNLGCVNKLLCIACCSRAAMSRERAFLFFCWGGGDPFPAFRECNLDNVVVALVAKTCLYVHCMDQFDQLTHFIQHLDAEKHRHNVVGQLRGVWSRCCLVWKPEGCQNGLSEFSQAVPFYSGGFCEHLPGPIHRVGRFSDALTFCCVC